MPRLIGSRSADLRGLLGPRTIAVLPIGSTEPHGPHLPLETDALLAAERGRRAGTQLEARGVQALVLPTLPYGVTRLAQDFDGGVTLRPGTLWSLIEDILLSLEQDGLRQLVICNAHHEYEHERILRNICTDRCARGAGACQVIYPEAEPECEPRFSEEECFGGRRETSMLLAAAPHCVDLAQAKGLAPFEFQLPDPSAKGNRSLLELGVLEGYIGAPAEATAEEGERLLDAWAGALVESCARHWPELFDGPR